MAGQRSHKDTERRTSGGAFGGINGLVQGKGSKAGHVDLSHTEEDLRAKVKMLKLHVNSNRLSLTALE